jgi:hypothetical protein
MLGVVPRDGDHYRLAGEFYGAFAIINDRLFSLGQAGVAA